MKEARRNFDLGISQCRRAKKCNHLFSLLYHHTSQSYIILKLHRFIREEMDEKRRKREGTFGLEMSI